MKMKVVINRCHGGFGLSEKAVMRYAELSGIDLYRYKDPRFGLMEYYKVPKEEFDRIKTENPEAYSFYNSLIFFESSIKRTDPILIQVIEELGELESSDDSADLKIVEIPDNIEWKIHEYDGIERVVEKHRTWS